MGETLSEGAGQMDGTLHAVVKGGLVAVVRQITALFPTTYAT
jgi:hypothetical protein